jgi:hypothetical protein
VPARRAAALEIFDRLRREFGHLLIPQNGMLSSMSRLADPPLELAVSFLRFTESDKNLVPFLLVLIQPLSQCSTPSTLSEPE